jgi:hypothetical protein
MEKVQLTVGGRWYCTVHVTDVTTAGGKVNYRLAHQPATCCGHHLDVPLHTAERHVEFHKVIIRNNRQPTVQVLLLVVAYYY